MLRITPPTFNLKCQVGSDMLGIMDFDANALYLFSLEQNKSLGYIDTKEVFRNPDTNKITPLNEQSCTFSFPKNHIKGSMIPCHKDSVLLLSERNAEMLASKQRNRWTVIARFDHVLGFAQQDISSLFISESFYGRFLFVLDGKHIFSKSKFATGPGSEEEKVSS